MSTSGNKSEISEVSRVIAWEIADFFDVALEKPSYDICSPEFTSPGGSWCLDMVSIEETCEWILLALVKRKGSNDSVFPLLNVEIVLRRGDGTMYKSDSSDKPDLESVLHGSYFFWFPRSKIFQGRCAIAREGTMTAICKMSFGKECSALVKYGVEAYFKGEPSLTGTDRLAKDFKELLLSGEESNLVIQLPGAEFRAHSGILSARTPVFYSMFEHDMTEKNTGVVVIEEVTPRVFWEFLHYVYTGALLWLSVDNVFGLYVISDKYQVDELKAECLDFIKTNVSTDTFCDAVTVALTYQEAELLEISIDFFSRNIKNIIITEKWKTFLRKNPAEANDLLIEAICD